MSISLFPPVHRHRDPHAGVTTITNTTNTAEVQFAGPMVRPSALSTNRSFRTGGHADREVEQPARVPRESRAELLCKAVSFRGVARPDPEIELMRRLHGEDGQ